MSNYVIKLAVSDSVFLLIADFIMSDIVLYDPFFVK